MFLPLDKKWPKMIVRTINQEVFENIKNTECPHDSYSYIMQSKIKEAFTKETFFKAEFMNWSNYEEFPYANITEELGSINDSDNYKRIVLLENGISQEMYPFKAVEQAKKLVEDYETILEQQRLSRKDLTEDLVITIDNPSSQALDDAISLINLTPSTYKLKLHIADVAPFIEKGTPLDLEALKRSASVYVLRDFFLPMLPRELNSNLCSILPDQTRLAITLSVDINDEGLLDLEKATYETTIIQNKVRLSYQEAEALIEEKFDQVEDLNVKLGKEKIAEVSEMLKTLYKLMNKRREFRGKFDKIDGNEETLQSEKLIEELMLITSQTLPYIKNKIIKEAETIIKDKIQADADSIIQTQS